MWGGGTDWVDECLEGLLVYVHFLWGGGGGLSGCYGPAGGNLVTHCMRK